MSAASSKEEAWTGWGILVGWVDEMVYANKNQQQISHIFLAIFGVAKFRLIYFCTFGFLMPAFCEGKVKTSWDLVGWLDGMACVVYKRGWVARNPGQPTLSPAYLYHDIPIRFLPSGYCPVLYDRRAFLLSLEFLKFSHANLRPHSFCYMPGSWQRSQKKLIFMPDFIYEIPFPNVLKILYLWEL